MENNDKDPNIRSTDVGKNGGSESEFDVNGENHPAEDSSKQKKNDIGHEKGHKKKVHHQMDKQEKDGGSVEDNREIKARQDEEMDVKEEKFEDLETAEDDVTPFVPLFEEGMGADYAEEDRWNDRPLMPSMTPSVLDIVQFLPPEAIKTVKLKPAKKYGRHKPKIHFEDKDRGPVASKVIFLKKPDSPVEGEEPVVVPLDMQTPATPPEEPMFFPPPSPQKEEDPSQLILSVVDSLDKVDVYLKDKEIDLRIEARLNDLMDEHRGDKLKKLKKALKARQPKYKFADMIKTLNKMGIPCPTNEDYRRLHGTHSKWDPDGTVVEYFSPVLRSFIPVNMRGRYRGCWPNDTCMKGVNISNVPPKRDALEGFIERGRHANIQDKYDTMREVAVDETHLDYLIEMQAFQAETLPIPIFYDMLHLGIQVANECLRILVLEEGYPPNNPIFSSQLAHAEELRRKIQMYGALGLERVDSKRRGHTQYAPHWLKSREELVQEAMEVRDKTRYFWYLAKEKEAKEKEMTRTKQKTRRPSSALKRQDSSGSKVKMKDSGGTKPKGPTLPTASADTVPPGPRKSVNVVASTPASRRSTRWSRGRGNRVKPAK